MRVCETYTKLSLAVMSVKWLRRHAEWKRCFEFEATAALYAHERIMDTFLVSKYIRGTDFLNFDNNEK